MVGEIESMEIAKADFNADGLGAVDVDAVEVEAGAARLLSGGVGGGEAETLLGCSDEA